MKHIRKVLISLCFALLCFAVLPTSSQAASAPAKVKNLKASSGEKMVTLKWKRVSGAAGYYIYRVNTTDNTLKKIATVTSGKTTSVKVKKLSNGTKYTFSVSAYKKSGKKKVEGKKSSYVSVTPRAAKPSVPSVKISSCSDEKVVLKWNKVSKATGYEVFQKNASGKYVSIGTTKKTSVTIKNLENGKSYQFKVRAYRKSGGDTRNGNLSSAVTGKPVVITSAVKSIHSMYYSASVKSTVRAKRADGKGTVKVAAGTKVTVTNRASGTSTVELKNGTEVKIATSNLRWISCLIDSKKDLSKSTTEAYVNSKGYSSPSNYLIWISLHKQRLYVFKGSQCNWKRVKSFQCSSGKVDTPTPKGQYRICRKSYKFWFDEDCYAYYATFFSGNAIHSWLLTPGDRRYNDGVIGSPASHGCVRLNKMSQCKYVYALPIGTTVIIY